MEDIKKQKLEMWNKKLIQLRKELEEIIQRRGEAARDGDLSENAAFKQASEDADSWRARIEDIRKIISDLENGKGSVKKA